MSESIPPNFVASEADVLRFKAMSYYEILGVDQRATEGEIKKAYRQKAKQYHPDKIGGRENPPDFRTFNP